MLATVAYCVALCVALAGCASGTPHPGARLASHRAAIVAARANAITVSPLPGTPDASPQTQISFLGPRGLKVLSVHAVGSSSGFHPGRLEVYSTGTGESFLPARRFANGESVAVEARVEIDKRIRSVGTSFHVVPEVREPTTPFPAHPADPAQVQHFHSAPQLQPSAVEVVRPASAALPPGDFFLAPYQGTGAPGPMIVGREGGLIWFHPLPAGYDSTNFEVQSYAGRPVLTWWQGRILKLGFGQGEDEIFNSSYRHVATVKAGNGYHADLHEFRLTPEGTAWIDMFVPVRENLSAYGGSISGVVSDSVIEEIDVKTGLVMWEWHALGHIPLSDSRSRPPHGSYPWDAYHINSIDPRGSGELLISARNTWTIYDLELHSGAVRWRFGNGDSSSFRLGAGVRFYWQHDAEWQPGGEMSVFDNGSSPPLQRESAGLLLRPEERARRVRLSGRLRDPGRPLLASSQGNVLRLNDGDWVVGFGEQPRYMAFDPAGRLIYEATLGENVQSFRTYFAEWKGQPQQPPALSVAGGRAYASWNGATGVASWRLLAGPSKGSLSAVATAPAAGFETALPVAGAGGGYAEAQALSASGAVLGTSAAIAVP
ncbi:MAG: arylsulfotransferase family protein [Solirubrobacteraceae bacterium]